MWEGHNYVGRGINMWGVASIYGSGSNMWEGHLYVGVVLMWVGEHQYVGRGESICGEGHQYVGRGINMQGVALNVGRVINMWGVNLTPLTQGKGLKQEKSSLRRYDKWPIQDLHYPHRINDHKRHPHYSYKVKGQHTHDKEL